jgi:hypothetical protein
MDHQSLLTGSIWKLMDVAVRSLSVPVFAPGTETVQNLLRVRERPIVRTVIHGWVQRKELPYGRYRSKRTESLQGLEQAD